MERIKLPLTLPAILAAGILLLSGCAANRPIDQIDLMPPPDVFDDGLLNPLPEFNPFNEIPYGGILYATDRRLATAEDKEKFYVNGRGQVVRFGVAQVELGEKSMSWERARIVSMLKSRTEKYPIKVENTDDWGIMKSSVPYWTDLDLMVEGDPPSDATDRYAQAINAQLARSERKDVYIYVHGYKVVFENPVLVATELWHFLGYDGAFIAYAWPSTPSKFAYLKDSDTSNGYARNFRLLLEFLAEKTDAERIHILAYSNGTRLVTRALEQLALINLGQTADENHKKLRIQNVILVGSDLDREVFGSYVSDGLLNVSKHMTVYMSKYDKALGVSQFLTRRDRVGQMWGDEVGEIKPYIREGLIRLRDQISIINASDAEGAGTGNGHGYFTNSPWVSSDVLMALTYGLTAEERGLVEQPDLPVYTFPPGYISRLWSAIENVDPEFAEKYRMLKDRQAASAP